MTAQIDAQPSSKPVTRLLWVDYAKGLGIFLVVLGHVLRGLADNAILSTSFLFDYLDQWIYAFHMPLFFFLSGLFLYRSTSRPFKAFVINRLTILVYPYLVWSLIQESLQSLTYGSGDSSAGFLLLLDSFWKILYQPPDQFWFLYILFVISLAYAIFHRLRLSSFSFLVASTAAYFLLILEVSSGVGVFNIARHFAIYLAVGTVVGQSSELMLKLKSIKSLHLLVFSIGSYLILSLAVFWGWNNQVELIPLAAAPGMFASICLAGLLVRFDFYAFIGLWGHFSLEIFLVHVIVIAGLRIALQSIFGIANPFIHIVAGTLAGIYLPIMIGKYSRHTKLRYLFTYS
ncbi:acyltransferase [Leptolyngbya sp. BC1307]|uniref:acyltransferase family protein n=1 Tax=Leptolyngbya sp. BC1307 TaxID=2029589 RepID=UPI000EFB8C7E|nr:acyltransferase [Leptolyngbya sp. BC1307]